MKTVRNSGSRKFVPCEVFLTKRTFRIAYLVLPNYDVPRQEEGAPAPVAKGEKQSA